MDDDRGQELVDIALRLMAQPGFDGTSITQIAAAAGVSPQSVATRFETTDAIVLVVVDDMLAALSMHWPLSSRDSPQAMCCWQHIR